MTPPKPPRKPNRNYFERFLGVVERVGNMLPHPGTLFLLLALAVIVFSAIAARTGIEAAHPGTGEIIRPVSLMTLEGFHRILLNMVPNFTGFAPLGTVLVALLGIGVAEGSGLIATVLRLLVLSAPRSLLTVIVVFAGVLSNTASEIGYVLLVPLAAIIFLAAGRHPVAGLAAAFAGVSGGYSANLVIGTIDPLLAGISTEAARIIDTTYEVNPLANWYFMIVSTFIITAAGTWVTEKVVVPRLGEFRGDAPPEKIEHLSPQEKRGLVYAGVAFVALVAFLLWGMLPADGFLREIGTGDALRSVLVRGVVAFIFLGGFILGIAYGIGAGTIKSDADAMKGMSKSMETLGMYLVLVFFMAQFVAYFGWTNLGLIIAVKGAEVLQASGLGPIPLMVAFVVLSAFINMFMGSASAKWAVMGPVFIPMFMILGYTPELVQVAYRIGDSVTNIISPMMSYFALIIAFVQRYDKNAGIGTIIATMLPYTLVFLGAWIILLIVWMLLGLPIGPGAGLYLE